MVDRLNNKNSVTKTFEIQTDQESDLCMVKSWAKMGQSAIAELFHSTVTTFSIAVQPH
jgi:hypothetical protein